MAKRPRSDQAGPRVDPGTPHRFQVIDDSGLALFSAGTAGRGMPLQPIASIVMTDNYIRKSKCGVPGCGKLIDDPIHTAAD
jgi:hypothetical protein